MKKIKYKLLSFNDINNQVSLIIGHPNKCYFYDDRYKLNYPVLVLHTSKVFSVFSPVKGALQMHILNNNIYLNIKKINESILKIYENSNIKW